MALAIGDPCIIMTPIGAAAARIENITGQRYDVLFYIDKDIRIIVVGPQQIWAIGDPNAPSVTPGPSRILNH